MTPASLPDALRRIAKDVRAANKLYNKAITDRNMMIDAMIPYLAHTLQCAIATATSPLTRCNCGLTNVTFAAKDLIKRNV